MGSLNKRLVLNVPVELLYKTIKFNCTSEDWAKLYYPGNLPKGRLSIIWDEPHTKFEIKVTNRNQSGSLFYHFKPLNDSSTQLTITYRFDDRVTELDKLILFNEIVSLKMFELGYNEKTFRAA